MFGVQSIQGDPIDQDQQDEDQDAALLREPEPQRKAAQAELVQRIGEQHATAETGDEPPVDPEAGIPSDR